MSPKFLFVSEPTRGIDIGAKKLVLETLVRLNRELGMTVVIVSSELQELKSVSDRIAIVSEGKLVDILSPQHQMQIMVWLCPALNRLSIQRKGEQKNDEKIRSRDSLLFFVQQQQPSVWY